MLKRRRLMAIFKSLIRILISKALKNQSNSSSSSSSRNFFTLSLSSTSPILQSNHNHCNIRRHFLFRSRFLSPVGGPLFLSNPPWKLSQSATPLLLQSDVVLNFLKLRALNLLHRPSFSNNVAYECGAQKLLSDGGGGGEQYRINGVEIDGISDSYLNVPNLISFARLLSGPVLGCDINEVNIPHLMSAFNSQLDGYVARKMRINSVVGSYLDPLADKVLIGCVALAMVDKGLLHPGLVALVLIRDVGLVGGAVYKRSSSFDWERNSWSDFFKLDEANVQKVEPLLISKVNTVFQLALVAAALLQPGFGNEETQLYIDYLSWLVASTTVTSTAAYGAQHIKNTAALMKSSKFRD